MTTTIRPHLRVGRTQRFGGLGSRTMRGPTQPVARTRAPVRGRARVAAVGSVPSVEASVLTAVAGLGLFLLALVTVELRTDVTAEGFAIRTVRQEADQVRHQQATLQTRLEQRLFAER